MNRVAKGQKIYKLSKNVLPFATIYVDVDRYYNVMYQIIQFILLHSEHHNDKRFKYCSNTMLACDYKHCCLSFIHTVSHLLNNSTENILHKNR